MTLEGGGDHNLKSLSFILCSWSSNQLARVGDRDSLVIGILVQQPVFMLFARLRQR